MFFDLNVPIPNPASTSNGGRAQSHSQNQSKKGKGKALVGGPVSAPAILFSPAEVARIEARVDLLVRLGYTVVAFTQTVQTKVDAKSHHNFLDPLLGQLRKRQGVLFLKRLTIILDEDSEKGFGLTSASASLFTPYDMIALQPTTAPSFSLACLTHTTPSPLTAHIIALPLTLPRLPFHLKHTLVRTALKNGAVFEINYAGALSAQGERRNWWAAAREVARVTKGKGVLVSSGAENDADLRAPRDIGNIITLLGLAQDAAHHAATTTAKSLTIRAQTRKTYRAVLSEPVLILPALPTSPTSTDLPVATQNAVHETPVGPDPQFVSATTENLGTAPDCKKRPREEEGNTVDRDEGKRGTAQDSTKRKRSRKGKGP